MSSAAASAQTALVSDLESAEAIEAMAAPPAKKARTEPPKSFKEIDVEVMELKEVEGKKKEKYLLCLSGNQVPCFLLTPDEPAKIIWGFDMNGAVEERSFNSEKEATGNESLSIRVELDKEQVEFLEKLEAKYKTLLNVGVEIWKPLLTKKDQYDTPSTTISVGLSGEESSLTLLKFKQGDAVEKGHGWTFLKTQADIEKPIRNAFTGAEIKTIVKLRAYRIVNHEGKLQAGLKLAAAELFIKPKPRVVIDFLEDW